MIYYQFKQLLGELRRSYDCKWTSTRFETGSPCRPSVLTIKPTGLNFSDLGVSYNQFSRSFLFLRVSYLWPSIRWTRRASCRAYFMNNLLYVVLSQPSVQPYWSANHQQHWSLYLMMMTSLLLQLLMLKLMWLQQVLCLLSSLLLPSSAACFCIPQLSSDSSATPLSPLKLPDSLPKIYRELNPEL